MRVRRVEVKGLFGVFHHVIPLRMDERVTIIHGPNGFGKTILLEMINGALMGNYAPFRRVPFEEFSIQFDDASLLTMRKGRGPTSDEEPLLDLQLTQPDGTAKEISTNEEKKDSNSYISPSVTRYIEHQLPFLRRVGERRWRHADTRQLLSLEEIIQEYGLILDEIGPRQYTLALDTELRNEFRHGIDIRLVQTRRLDAYSKGRFIATVRRYSDELATEIRDTLALYAAHAQELDRTFPTRVLGDETVKPLSPQKLKKALEQQEQKRAELVMLGFLDSEVHLPAVPPITNTAKLDVMSIYVQDVNKKLAVFDGLATKLRVFTDILRNRFQYKTFSIHRDRGIVFTSPDNSNLPITALSSGEQHEIVMLYELLFKAKNDSLVLIDEPELSLHLLWQQSFLDDLLKIVKLSNIDVLLATHSPDLVGAHWNLTEALKGPQP